MKNTDISVILPFYNCEKYLESAVKSVLNQTFSNFELLLLNDASTDNSEELVCKLFLDKRISYYKNKQRQGLAKNLNLLVNKAKSEIIARMDGDDISDKNRFLKQFTFLRDNPNISLVGSFIKEINEDGELVRLRNLPQCDVEIRKVALNYNPFAHPSVMFRKKDIVEVGGYREEFPRGQDYDLWLRLIYAGYKVANIPEYLTHYRIRRAPDPFEAKTLSNLFKTKLEVIKQYRIPITLWQWLFIYLSFISNRFLPNKISHLLGILYGRSFEYIFKLGDKIFFR